MNDLKKLTEFVIESNAIENEHSLVALQDSLRAWDFSTYCKKMFIENIEDIHFYVMEHLWPEIAGKIRKENVTVGGRLCPNPGQLQRLLFQWVSKHGGAKTEKSIKAAHVAFEKIHCFRDGNGRTGRIIMNWQRVRAGLPLLIIHAGEEQQEYYTWFK